MCDAKGRPIIRDISDPDARKDFERYEMVKTLGESNYPVKLAYLRGRDGKYVIGEDGRRKEYAIKVIYVHRPQEEHEFGGQSVRVDKKMRQRRKRETGYEKVEREIKVMCHVSKLNAAVTIYTVFRREIPSPSSDNVASLRNVFTDFTKQQTHYQSAGRVYYLVMERGHGTLNNYIDTYLPPRIATAERIRMLMLTLALLVQQVHGSGVVHGDLKPQNIMYFRNPASVNGAPRIKLIDFGMACLLGTSQVDCNNWGGTRGYMDPWIAFQNGRRPSKASDIYSLGVIFFNLLNPLPATSYLPSNYKMHTPEFNLQIVTIYQTKYEHGRQEFSGDREKLRLHNITFAMLAPFSRRPSADEVVGMLRGDIAVSPPNVLGERVPQHRIHKRSSREAVSI